VKESLAWGTKIVGGVKPGVEGEHLGLPVFPSVKAVRHANDGLKLCADEDRPKSEQSRMHRRSMSPAIKQQKPLKKP
jgi:hypothetical protein